jgi:hypothetical protein
VVVNGDREHLLGVVLADDVVVEHLLDLGGLDEAEGRLGASGAGAFTSRSMIVLQTLTQESQM